VALFKQIGELGVLDKMILITSFNSNPITKAASTEGEVGGIGSMVYHYTLPRNPINDWLVENHKADYNGEFPDLFTECGFATAQALVAALKATEGDTSTEKMIAALEGLEWEGPRGKYVMRASDHQVMLPIYIVRLVNLTDPEFKFYELVREVPAEFVTPPCALPEQYAERCK
jgi:branched-chain amino acid transport system substrate-binding protein